MPVAADNEPQTANHKQLTTPSHPPGDFCFPRSGFAEGFLFMPSCNPIHQGKKTSADFSQQAFFLFRTVHYIAFLNRHCLYLPIQPGLPGPSF